MVYGHFGSRGMLPKCPDTSAALPMCLTDTSAAYLYSLTYLPHPNPSFVLGVPLRSSVVPAVYMCTKETRSVRVRATG